MLLRSLLFVPADAPRKRDKALGAGADAVIFDLEDSVAPSAKADARAETAAFLSGLPEGRRWHSVVRINPLSSGLAGSDLAAVVGPGLDAIMVPKADGPADVAGISRQIDLLEAEAGLAAGGIKLLVIATETARSLFTIGDYAAAGLTRLAGLTWGAEDLSADLGAATNRDETGAYAAPYLWARTLCLTAARAAGVAPIDGVFTAFRDADGLAREAAIARRDGFVGKMAIHPDQVPVINAAFTPSAEEIASAQAVLAAFAAAPGAGVVALEGRMLDRPHQVQAERVLALAAAVGAL